MESDIETIMKLMCIMYFMCYCGVEKSKFVEQSWWRSYLGEKEILWDVKVN